jgi:tRNA-2-methylthio-N6-dimethylallyladenosine synthase
MNEYDSGKMRDVLEAAHGMTPTDNPAEADVLLVNTCSVREKAQEKVFSLLGEWRLFKQQRPHVVIGVGGCVASQEGEGITARAPFVDLVFGPQTLHRLPAMLRGLQLSGNREIRPAAGAARGRRNRIRLDHGRLQQVLQLLRRALYAR